MSLQNKNKSNPWLLWVADQVLLSERTNFWQWYFTGPLLIISLAAYLLIIHLLTQALLIYSIATSSEREFLLYLNSGYSFFVIGNVYSFIFPLLSSLFLILLIAIVLSIRAKKPVLGLTYSVTFSWVPFWKAAGTLSLLFAINIVILNMTKGDFLSIENLTLEIKVLFCVALGILFIQSLSEELLYRGFLLRTIGAIFPYRLLAIGFVLALFVLHHKYTNQQQANLLPALIFFISSELLYFWLLFRTRSVMATLGLRWVNNAVFTIIITIAVPGESTLSLLKYSSSFTNIENSYFENPATYILQFISIALFVFLILWKRSPMHLGG